MLTNLRRPLVSVIKAHREYCLTQKRWGKKVKYWQRHTLPAASVAWPWRNQNVPSGGTSCPALCTCQLAPLSRARFGVGSGVLSHPVARAVPSALTGLTAGFDMVPGGPPWLQPPTPPARRVPAAHASRSISCMASSPEHPLLRTPSQALDP